MNTVSGVRPITYHAYSTEEAMKPPETKTQTTRTEETSGANVVKTNDPVDFGKTLTNVAKQEKTPFELNRIASSEADKNNMEQSVKPVMYKGLGSVVDINA